MRKTTVRITNIDVQGWECPNCGKIVVEFEEAEKAITGKRGDIIVRQDTQYITR